MFSNSIILQIAAVVLSLCLVVGMLYIMKLMSDKLGLGTNIFISLAVLSFALMLALFTVDTIIAYRTDLLDKNERAGIFELFKNLFLVVLGYFFRDLNK